MVKVTKSRGGAVDSARGTTGDVGILLVTWQATDGLEF